MPKGNKRVKYGLRVAWHEKIIEYQNALVASEGGPGWYIEVYKTNVRTNNGWRAIGALRFARRKDADWAMECLKAAGLGCLHAMEKAGASRVLEVATQDLQW